MNISEQFDRLDRLILDRSTDIAQMRGILHTIREQTEAYQKDAESHAALKEAHQKLEAELARLNQAPRATVVRSGGKLFTRRDMEGL